MYFTYQHDVVVATNVVYQTAATASAYQVLLALFFPFLVVAIDALAAASLASFAAFL